MLPTVWDRALAELGRAEGGADTLALLARDQDTRRLLLLRAVLDAAQGADPAVCGAAEKARLRDDWALFTEADRAAPTGPPAPGDPDRFGASFARARLLHPLTGPWALSCLRGLDPAERPPTPESARELRRALAHFSALAAVAAARAGIPFAAELTAYDGVLNLPSLGTLHTATAGDTPVRATFRQGRVTLRQHDAPDVTVFLERGFGAWSGALAWTPAYALPGLVPEAAPMALDDLDPYRTARGDTRHRALSAPTTLDDPERKRWLQAWSGTAAALRSGGEHRLTEALTLLRCLVPLEMPPGAEGHGGCSATRRDAFGALLCSTPPSPVAFAGTLVHELQHAKLAALSDMTTLHRAGPDARYFAPWRPDPRPFDGLLQGAYAHLGLADFFQRRALAADSAHQEPAWAQHARYRAQVGAVLPALVGSLHLTARGRRFVDAMATAYERMAEDPAPRGHTARAQAYLKAARTLWTRRQTSSTPWPNG
ncbi:HEXXH motif-containing putative peptide modification protein [Streptomyces sp. NBC_01485]|uniref:aKG-HExxH-type peptide beta-hydroxylase n=1 Tax=Streptomyces sp. NBC_01485 TaxID=2903884 RepID=UPI002E362145|nr:HEXXH motif-containing putative peptide modification protein [Streptomyces sp. NBC_01485]